MTMLITTIGTTDYQTTTYCFSDEARYSTCYVAEAIALLKQVNHIIFLMTEKAKAKHWEPLQHRFRERQIATTLACCDIPEGQTEEEIWQIFDRLVEVVPPDSQVIFDITHAFRSIPLLVLLGAAFLRQAKKVTIEGLYYGLYQSGRELSPIIDLTPALALLDWLTATHQFIATGSAVELGQLLNQVQQDFYRTPKATTSEQRPTTLKRFGTAIQEVSRSLELVRPESLLKEDLPRLTRIPTNQLAQEVGQFAKPFSLLLERVQRSYRPLALQEDTPQERIRKQFRLLQWYVEQRLPLQALLLAREWTISALCLLAGYGDYLQREHREAIEQQLGAMIGRGGHPNLAQPVAALVPDAQQLANCWSRLTDYRNDLAHAQMRKDALSGQVLETFALGDLLPTLQALFPGFVNDGTPG